MDICVSKYYFMDIRKLAKKLNLSITTVSRALGGYSDVSETTRKKVIKYAKKYKYSPNPNASSLASGKSNTLGFVIPLYGLNSNTLNQASFFEFIAGMSTKIHSENIQFFMMFANNEKEEKNAYEKLIHVQKVNKIILHNIKIKDSRIAMLKKNKIKFVAWGRTQGLNNYSWVDLDNEESAKVIMEYLIEKNHRHIAYANIEENYNFAFQRKQGYLSSLKKNKIKFNENYYISIKNEDPDQSASAIKKMLNKYSKITAIICSTEYSAVGAIKACNQLNKKIGKDISIITFDGPVVSTIANPSLTAITHERKKLGQKAIEILTDMDKNNKTYTYLAKANIIDRGSVCKLKKK